MLLRSSALNCICVNQCCIPRTTLKLKTPRYQTCTFPCDRKPLVVILQYCLISQFNIVSELSGSQGRQKRLPQVSFVKPAFCVLQASSPCPLLFARSVRLVQASLVRLVFKLRASISFKPATLLLFKAASSVSVKPASFVSFKQARCVRLVQARVFVSFKLAVFVSFKPASFV
jgi:hypothetical protein